MTTASEKPINLNSRDQTITAAAESETAQVTSIAHAGNPCLRRHRRVAEQKPGHLGDPQQPRSAHARLGVDTLGHVDVEPNTQVPVTGGKLTQAQQLAATVRAGALSRDEAFAAWCASGWQPPAGVTAGSFDGRGRWRLVAVGRRKPVVGMPTRDERGWYYGPANKNSRRQEDAELLDGVASVVGMSARVPRNGRPRRGTGENAARFVESEVDGGVQKAKAVQAAYEHYDWDTQSIERHLRRRAKSLDRVNEVVVLVN